MKKLHITAFFLQIVFGLFGFTFGIEAQHVSIIGHVLNGATHKPFPFVSIYLNKTKFTATTDTLGYFNITDIPVGEYELVASAIGYKTEKQTITLSTTKQIQMRIFLNRPEANLNDSKPIIPLGQLATFTKNWSEKVYVQTDRSCYFPGDTVWVKAMMKYSNQLYRDSLSKVLHVEIYTREKKVVAKKLLQIKNGECQNGIVLSDKFPIGDYYLLAYTRWMLNFNDYFIKPLPIIDPNRVIVADRVDTISLIPSGVNLKVELNKLIEQEKTKSLKIKVSESTDKVKSISVGVTDLYSNPDIKNSPTVASFDNRFKGKYLSTLTIDHLIENAIVYKGQVHKVFNGKRERKPLFYESMIVKAFAPSYRKSFLSGSVNNGKFEIAFDFTDTTSVTFIGQTNNGSYYGDIEIESQDTIKFDFAPLVVQYAQQNYQPQGVSKRNADRVNLLDEVTVKANRIGPQKVLKLPKPSIALDLEIRSTKIEDIKAMRKMNSLGNAVQSMVNGLEIEAVWDGTKIYVYGKASGLLYRFYLNGNRIYYNDLLFTSASGISKISVHGAQGTSGYGIGDHPEDQGGPIAGNVLIYTEPYLDVNLNPQAYTIYKINGYDKVIKFTQSSSSEFGSTLYWNPSLALDNQREAFVDFSCSNCEVPLKITIEGLTESGDPIRMVKIVNF